MTRRPVTLMRRLQPVAALVFTGAAFAVLPLAAQHPTRPPAPGAIKPAAFPPFQETTLPNGVRLLLVESHRQPALSMSLSFPAGNAYDAAGKEGLSDLVATLLTKGAGTRSADEISAAIEGVGGQVSASAGADFITVTANVLSSYAPLAFALLADVAARPTFAADEVELARTKMLSALQLELSRPASLASRFFAANLYGTAHPYGRRAAPASVKAITREDLVAFQKARLRPRGALLVIAGDLKLADARRLATQAFGGWSGSTPAPAVFPTPPARTKTEILLVHRPGSVQSNIVAGNTTFTPNDPRFYAATLANKVLGGGADSRLFLILREQKSWTYGAGSGLSRRKGLGYFQASTEVRTEVTDSALAELLVQLKRIGSETVAPTELESARNAMVGSFPLSIETAEQVASAVTQARLLGLPENYLRTYRTRLASVSAQQLQAAAKSVIRSNALLIVVVGDAEKVYDRISTLAPTRVVDAQGNAVASADLKPRAATLDIDMAALVPRSDSFSVVVQGRPFGFQRVTLEKTADGWRYSDDTQIGPIVQQHTEVTFGNDLQMRAVKQSGKMQGQDMKIDVTYAAGRAKGSATTPGPQGMKSVAFDTTVTAGSIDDNAVTALIPAMRWAAGAKIRVPEFASGKGESRVTSLNVVGEEKVTVPAGTFNTWKVEVTGGEQPATFFVSKDSPHRLVKIVLSAAPVEIQLAK